MPITQPDWNISRITRAHDRTAFASGQASLDAFLRTHVMQYEKRHLARTFVATEPDEVPVAGYHTLANGALDASFLQESLRKKLPRHPIPTLHLARLAVDLAYRGQRLGETWLFHALKLAIEMSGNTGIFGVDVWAIDAVAVGFYCKFGFMRLEDDPFHLLAPMNSVEKMFGL